MLLKSGRVLLLSIYALLVPSLLLFSLFELFPGLLDLVNIQSIALID